MTGQKDLPALIDQLGAAALDCRELLADVRSATKELRAAIRDAEQTKAGLASAVKEMVEADVGELVKENVEALGETTRQAMDAAVDKVNREFDKLTNIMMTGDSRGRPTDGFDLRRVARQLGTIRHPEGTNQ